MVSATAISLYGDRRLLMYHDHFVMYANIKSLCSTSETNITLPINYISVKILKFQVRRIKIYWFFFLEKTSFYYKKILIKNGNE